MVWYNQDMFTFKTKIRLHDTDAAGIIFFANQFKIIHDAYEEFLEKIDLSMKTILKKTGYFQPIVHAESTYKAPIYIGDKIVVSVKIGHVGKTSFSLEYTLKRGKNLVGTAKTVHVTIDQKTSKKIPLPTALRRALEKYIH
jgi:1,4-dihydroxy-2-naphthoyl-CoA hydrolase